MDGNTVTALLAILSALAGAQIFVTRSLINRSDRAQRMSDKHISSLISAMQSSVDAFGKFEVEEKRVHARLVETQEKIIAHLERLEERLT